MDQNKNLIEVDPDYEINNTALRNIELKEEQEKKLTESKLKKIIQDEFDKELTIREKQIEGIEQQIFKAQKLLHVVRYVLITSYYNKKALQYDTTQEECSMEGLNTLKGQNRIHPAIKKLLGAGAHQIKFLGARHKKKRRSDSSSHENKVANVLGNEFDETPFKKTKLTSDDASSTSSLDHHQTKFTSDSSSAENENLSMNRKKTEHKILVGNISYCKKSLEQDTLTHKWMVYVRIYRGSKDGPDVSSMIKKVVFYLHPSYKPHDVVEINESPFHLSRRGWGEFPVRVQILFKNSVNKPVDIIHNLKLGKTFIGRQTLGNETEVPIYLHNDLPGVPESSTNESVSDNIQIKFEYTNDDLNEASDAEIKEQLSETDVSESIADFIDQQFEGSKTRMNSNSTSLGLEHDYCFDEPIVLKNEVDNEDEVTVINHDFQQAEGLDNVEYNNYSSTSEYDPTPTESFLDHSYSLASSAENSIVIEKSSDSLNKSGLLDQPQNELIHGLGEHYLTNGRRIISTVRRTQKINSLKNKNKLPKILKTASGQAIRFLPQSFSRVLLSNGSIVQVKLVNQTQPVLRKIDQLKIKSSHNNNSTMPVRQNSYHQLTNHMHQKQKIDYEKYIVTLPENAFKNMGEVLPYVFKRLPLWTELAKDLDFKCTYPFTASSCEEYMSWNVGKRLSAEWARAKTIKRLLQRKTFSKRWNTKSIFMYGRSHLYTPTVSSYRIFQNECPEVQLLNECFSNSESRDRVVTRRSVVDDVLEIDVESDSDTSSRMTNGVTDVSDLNLQPHCAYIREAALDCGVYLKPEEIVEGVTMNVAERVILEAVKCFAEGLIRRARHHLVSQHQISKTPTEITVNEVTRALDERPEFRLIQNFQRQKFNMDFFS